MSGSAIDKAVAALKQGKVVAFPTETSYGLAVDAKNVKAIERLYLVKGRNFNKPVHVIFPSFSELNKAVKLYPNAKRLIQKFFPGPLTLVLPLKARGKNWQMLSAGSGTLGFRMPDHKIVRELVRKFGKPITATSANRSGRANCYSVKQARKQFAKSKNKPDYYLNGGKLKKVLPSTIVALTDTNIKLLREGPIPFDKIKATVR